MDTSNQTVCHCNDDFDNSPCMAHETVSGNAPKYRKGSFEAKMDELLPDNSDSFNLTFFELWRDCAGGWSVNDAWRPFPEMLSRDEAINHLRGRWEIFKLNYLPKARVQDIQDIGDMEGEFNLEVDCTAFADVRAY